MTQDLTAVLGDVDDPDAVSQVLADLEDPAAIKSFLDLLEETNNGESSSDSTSATTLEDHYDQFLERRNNRSPATITQYKRTIPELIDFVEAQGVLTPAQLSTNLIDQYVDTLENRYDSDSTIFTYTKNARTFLNRLRQLGHCDDAIYHMLSKDELGLSPSVRDAAIPESDAKHILQNLRSERRGTHLHAVMELTWNGGPRVGGVNSTDLPDFLPDDSTILFRHRPEQGTRLKNGSNEDSFPGDGERDVTIKPRVVDALQLYIHTNRHDVEDEYGRQPLFTTKQGRASTSTLRRWIYEATSCRFAPEDPELSCDGDCDPDSDVCPYSYSPHAIRRGAISNQLSNGLRRDRASERFDVSVPILKKHYDPRTKARQKDDRADAVRDAWSDW